MQYKNIKIVSICVPTYNRSNLLTNLLINLNEILIKYGDLVEICVSDNNSNDHTWSLLNEFKSKNFNSQIKIIKQFENNGSSQNVLDVIGMSTGRWVLVIGDDDGIKVDDFGNLLKILKISQENSWFILNSISGHNDFKTIKVHHKTKTQRMNIKKYLIRNGTSKIGFIGTHLMPGFIRENIKNARSKDERDNYFIWPHIRILYEYATCSNMVNSANLAPVIQSYSGVGAQFWPAKEFYKIEYKKALMCSNLKNINILDSLFFLILYARQVYSLSSIGFLISWKLKNEMDFNKYSISNIWNLSSGLSYTYKLLLMPNLILCYFINKTSVDLLKKIIPQHILKKIIYLHNKEDNSQAMDNPIKRKL
jgi:hypothetical protein